MLASPDPRLIDAIKSEFKDFTSPEDLKKATFNKNSLLEIFFRMVQAHGPEEASRLMTQFSMMLRFYGDENTPALSAIKLKRPKATITVDIAENIKHVLVADQRFKERVMDKSQFNDIDTGMILYSAIRYGGLLRTGQPAALLDALLNPISFYDGSHWLMLSLPGISQPQRWLPDNFTLLLMARWYKNNGQQILKEWRENYSSKKWFKLIKDTKLILISQSRMRKAIVAINTLSFPSALVEGAKGGYDNRTLSPEVFLRLLSGRKPTSPKASDNTVEPTTRKTFKSAVAPCGAIDSKDTALLRVTGNILRKGKLTRLNTGKEIYKCIESYHNNCTPITIYLCEWIATRMTMANRWGNKFGLKSAYTRQRSIARRLRGWMGIDDPIQLSKGRLVEIYEEIIDEAPTPGLRASISKNLRDFHEFMEDQYGIVPLNEDAPWGQGISGSTEVDAKVIWPNEYQEALSFLKHKSETEADAEQKHLWQARQLVLILGYRCGMRRREVLYLRKQDILVEETLVRPHSERSLKSSASNRRIPTCVLLAEDEKELLNDFACGPYEEDEYLFTPLRTMDPFYQESLLFDAVQWLLKQVTGDPAARFHHLRHSFATLNFWRWMHKPSNLPEYLEVLSEPSLNINRQRSLILNLEDGEQPSQKVLHALSMMIGHSGPSLTMAHYIHSADILFHECQKKELSTSFSVGELAKISGVSSRQVQKNRKSSITPIDAIKPRITHRLKSFTENQDINDWRKPKEVAIAEYGRETGTLRIYALDIWSAVLHANNRYFNINDIAERYCLVSSTLTNALSRAKEISDICHDKRARKTYRHHLKGWEKQAPKPIFFPYPKKKHHLQMVEKMVTAYGGLEEEDKSVVDHAVRYFINNGRAQVGDIPFKTKEDLERFLPIFDLLKLYRTDCSRKDVSCYAAILRGKYSGDSKERRKQWRYWNSVNGLAPRAKINKYKKSIAVNNGTLSVRVISPTENQSHKGRPKKESLPQSDWGFRLGLYVLALTYLDEL
jgi:integrase